MRRTFIIVNLAVFLIWISFILFLLYRNHFGTPFGKHVETGKHFSTITYWYDIYEGKEKIGRSITSFTKVLDEVIIKIERQMNVDRHGSDSMFREHLRLLCTTDHSIKSFKYMFGFDDEQEEQFSGVADEEKIVVFEETIRKMKKRVIAKQNKEPYVYATLIPAITSQHPPSGSVFLAPVLNLKKHSINTVRIELEDIRPVKIGIHVKSMYKFKIGNTILWGDDNGVIIKEELPGGVVIYSQAETFSQDNSDRVIYDYTDVPFFKSNIHIRNPERLKQSKVRIKGYVLNENIYKNSLASLKADVLTIRKEDTDSLKARTYELPFRSQSFSAYLSPDEWVQSDFEPVKRTGRIYARARGNDSFKLADYLTGYLYSLVRSRPLFFLSDTTDVLQSLSGDFLERSVMYASYARAGGMPTRIVGGLVYKDGYFYFHTWPEVWFDTWVPVDPTFTQFPADCLHIPLVVGTLKDVVSIINDLKNIEIEVLEVS